MFGAVVTVCVALAVLLFCQSTVYAKDGVALDRTWKTKDGKHSVEARLLKYSDKDLTLKLKNGTEKTIKLDLMSTEDVLYLSEFPSLKAEVKEELPWVRVKAIVKARSKTGTSRTRTESRSKSMEVAITNRSKQDLDLVVLYGFLVEELSGKSNQRQLTDINLQGIRTKNVKLGGQKDTSFVTEAMRTVEINGSTKGGSKDQGFIVQVYWKGQLLDGWTADSNFRELARDGSLLEKRGR